MRRSASDVPHVPDDAGRPLAESDEDGYFDPGRPPSRGALFWVLGVVGLAIVGIVIGSAANALRLYLASAGNAPPKVVSPQPAPPPPPATTGPSTPRGVPTPADQIATPGDTNAGNRPAPPPPPLPTAPPSPPPPTFELLVVVDRYPAVAASFDGPVLPSAPPSPSGRPPGKDALAAAARAAATGSWTAAEKARDADLQARNDRFRAAQAWARNVVQQVSQTGAHVSGLADDGNGQSTDFPGGQGSSSGSAADADRWLGGLYCGGQPSALLARVRRAAERLGRSPEVPGAVLLLTSAEYRPPDGVEAAHEVAALFAGRSPAAAVKVHVAVYGARRDLVPEVDAALKALAADTRGRYVASADVSPEALAAEITAAAAGPARPTPSPNLDGSKTHGSARPAAEDGAGEAPDTLLPRPTRPRGP